ncbi:channel protein [Fusarium phyllophilum]|uniref:Channel protein n=1 Tax=Fusarium phyllophilum TaxID=47803 RepID=A0A8H5JBW5_9HYPO|nr:channel protein [Fusarium phyllophilum]
MTGHQEQNHDYFSKPATPSTPGQVHLGNVASRIPSTISDRETGQPDLAKSTHSRRRGLHGLPSSFMSRMSKRPISSRRFTRMSSGHSTARPTVQQHASQYHTFAPAEEGYYEENPWFGEAGKKPIFSLGKPLPHRVRRKVVKPIRPDGKVDEEMAIVKEDSEDTPAGYASRTTSGQPYRMHTQTSIASRDMQNQQSRTTAAGVAHNEKRNDAGQPVFDYVPGEATPAATPSHRDPASRVASHQQSNNQPDYKIDSEPLGQQEKPEVEAGETDPNEMRNWWARIRAKHPEPLAEFLATSVAIFLGLTGTLSVNLSAKQSQPYGTYETSCWAWGFAWMFGIYLGGGVSGAHMNPAISISLSLFRGFPWRQCFIYILAQFIASIVAGALAYGIYADSIHYVDPEMDGMSKTFFSTPREWVSLQSAFFNQVVGSAIMMIAVFALGDDQNNPPGAGMHALVLGFLVTTLKFTLGYNIGSALNPASDFGPRVVAYAVGYRGSNVFHSGWWFYGPWAATLIGSVVGCALYDGFVFVGSESPINFRFSKEIKHRANKLLRD